MSFISSIVSSLSPISKSSLALGLGLGVASTAFLNRYLHKQISDLAHIDNEDNESGVCSSGDESDYSDVSDDEDLKLVLVVRQDLKMGKGKAAAQCCHATLAAYKRARRKCPDRLKVWEASGQPKITVKCDSEEELMLLMVKARSLDLVSYVVADAGRTQIAPGSHTVLAVGPAPAQLVDQVTGNLKLY